MDDGFRVMTVGHNIFALLHILFDDRCQRFDIFYIHFIELLNKVKNNVQLARKLGPN